MEREGKDERRRAWLEGLGKRRQDGNEGLMRASEEEFKKGERGELTHRHGHEHEKRCSKRLFKRFSSPVRAD
jgi:hypothetical protein